MSGATMGERQSISAVRSADWNRCREWSAGSVESQEPCPGCTHYGLWHSDSGCRACAREAESA